MKKAALSLVLVALVGGIASAEMLSVECSAGTGRGGEELVLNDVMVDTAGADWLSSLVYAELTSGSLYQDPMMGSLPWGHIAGLNDNDSWLAENVTVFGAADELASQPGMSGDSGNADLSITVIASTPTDPVPAWDGLAMRLAFSPDANGPIVFTVSAKGSGQTIIPLEVVNGCIVPEPGTIALLLCGLVGLCVLRRK